MLTEFEELNRIAALASGPESEAAADILPVAPPKAWNHEADIVIVGGGGAGLAAACRAADMRRSVIVLEKTSHTGGNAQHAEGAAVYGTKAQARANIKFDRDALIAQISATYADTISRPLLTTLIDRGHEFFDWAEDHGFQWGSWEVFGVPRLTCADKYPWWEDDPRPGNSRLLTFKPLTDWLRKFADGKGVQTLVSTKVLALVEEKGKILGVKAQTVDGKELFVKAKLGVVLASGGFTNNRAMLKKYIDGAAYAVGSTVPPRDTGEVLRMALGAGADSAGRGTWMGGPGGIPYYDTKYTGKATPGPWSRYYVSGDAGLARAFWLELNQVCEEFMPFNNLAMQLPAAAVYLAQPGHCGYAIFDADFPTTLFKWGPYLGRRPLQESDAVDPAFDFGIASHNWLDDVKKGIEWGGIKTSDTIVGLAKELGLDAGKLTKAVEAWNAKSSTGQMDEWGRPPEFQPPVKKAPYYGIKTGVAAVGTFFGARVNENFQVLDVDQNPIPGLYAAGETAGGSAGELRPQFGVLSCLGYGLASGFIAGETARA